MFARFQGKSFAIKYLAIVCFSILTVIISPLKASADTVGPVFTDIFPDNNSGLAYSQLTLSAVAVDKDFINESSVYMEVDGLKVIPYTQFSPIDESTDDYTRLEIYYTKNFSQGTHTVTLTVKDMQGNTGKTTWTFSIGQQAKIVSVSPANGQTVTSRTPTVTATVAPPDVVVADSVALLLNGTPVKASYNNATGAISYTPEVPLNDETSYQAIVSFRDTSGKLINTSWNFYVNTNQEMTYSVDDATCQKCHDRQKHPMNSCTKCHGVNQDASKPAYPVDDCYRCHYNSTKYPATYHTNGLPEPNPPEHPVQLTTSCIECHNKSWSGTAIPKAHDTLTTAIQHTTTSTGCSSCHSTSLTREHQKRLDAQGNAFTCFTCHNSPDSKVQNAIKNKDSSCTACHGAGGHPEHNDGLDQYCQTCHSSSILSEPQFHSKTGCATCHQNTDNPVVTYSINNKDTSCFACHNEGHGVNFVRKAPDDIPFYPGFKWSLPQDATIWAGESWLPADFNAVGAKVIVSNRRTDLTGTDLFKWYSDNFVQQGWQKLSGPTEGSDYFTLSYRKDNRRLNINVYTGESHDPGASFIGYRVEILYK